MRLSRCWSIRRKVRPNREEYRYDIKFEYSLSAALSSVRGCTKESLCDVSYDIG